MLMTKQERELPTLEEIAAMAPARLREERTHLRTEVAFLRDDSGHGGPSHETEIADLNSRIKAISERLAKGQA